MGVYAPILLMCYTPFRIQFVMVNPLKLLKFTLFCKMEMFTFYGIET